MKRGALIAVGGSAALFGVVAALTAFRPPLQTFDTLLSAARGHDVPAFVEGEDDPGVLRRAAVHYDLVCAECHGSPADPERGRHLVLVPPAPRLHDRLTDWTPALLYRVVHDGVPGSAMPGWTAPGRSDEVWAMVAFLLRLPDLDADEYAKVAAMDTVAEDDTVAICARCHLRDLDSAPRLGIQAPAYLADALQAFRSGARKSGFMQEVATELDAEAIEVLAERMSGEAREIAADSAPTIALNGNPDQSVGACLGCHGNAASPAYPRLAGQYRSYLETQLHLFMEDDPERGGGPWVALMHRASGELTEAEIAELADWFSRQ
jgi:cytochrome c553